MLSVNEAQEAILTSIETLGAIRVPIEVAHGLVLAEDVCADIDNPPFDNSAVDGYAVVAADTAIASESGPVILRQLAGVNAGEVPLGRIEPGSCARVMTGAQIPAGADAMIMREDARETPEGVAILASAVTGDHIRRKGENVRAGARVMQSGTSIGAAELGVLAMAGAANPLCIRRPRVAVFSTGDELVSPADKPGPGQIRDSNRFALAALVAECGAEIHSSFHLPDSLDETLDALRQCSGIRGNEKGAPADVIVTSGGVSVGDRDFVKPALEAIGRLEMWRVRMKPGKPVAFGRIPRPDGGQTLFFGLPGNPVSTMVTFELFVRPALWRLAGRRDLARPRISVRLVNAIDRVPGRQEFIRAMIRYLGSELVAEPTGAQGSSNLGSMLGANGLIIVPEHMGYLSPGSMMESLLIGPVLADEDRD